MKNHADSWGQTLYSGDLDRKKNGLKTPFNLHTKPMKTINTSNNNEEAKEGDHINQGRGLANVLFCSCVRGARCSLGRDQASKKSKNRNKLSTWRSLTKT